MSPKKYIRINDTYNRFDRIDYFKVERWFQTDSFAEIKIYTHSPSDIIQINLFTEGWKPTELAQAELEPKIKQISEFIEDALLGKLTCYEIEV